MENGSGKYICIPIANEDEYLKKRIYCCSFRAHKMRTQSSRGESRTFPFLRRNFSVPISSWSLSKISLTKLCLAEEISELMPEILQTSPRSACMLANSSKLSFHRDTLANFVFAWGETCQFRRQNSLEVQLPGGNTLMCLSPLDFSFPRKNFFLLAFLPFSRETTDLNESITYQIKKFNWRKHHV
jgi:hypothetical protein